MRTFAAASLAALVAVPTLQAAMTVRPLADYYGGDSYSSIHSGGIGGGEFRASEVSADLLAVTGNLAKYSPETRGQINGKWYFQTFCIETTEHFTPGQTYNVTLSGQALYNGDSENQSANYGPDPISIGTAFLYSQFAAGLLPSAVYDYDYGPDRSAAAKILQQAFWALEDEGSYTMPTTIANFLSANSSIVGANLTAWRSDAGANNFGVRVMNMGLPGEVQDHLIVVPEPSTIICGALLLLPFGVSSIRLLRKRA